MIPLAQRVMRLRTFLNSVQIGKMLSYGRNGKNTPSTYIQEVRSFYIFRLNVLTFSLDNADTPLVKGPSKPSRHPIQVRLGSGGAPVLPSITMNDLNNPYKTKDVQTMLAEYMRAHISMFPSQFEMATSHMTYMS